ncbi:MAG: hypothetical protein GEU86_12900 [Actinophytocola sp.]|nr:hypothetical protein [Actinophytocola sp.]
MSITTGTARPGTRPPRIRAVRFGGVSREGVGMPLPPGWVRDAVCAQTDPELFFPDKGGSTAAAKRICAGCPVRARCLDYALDSPVPVSGIWGGLSEKERRPLIKARNRARRYALAELDAQVSALIAPGLRPAAIAAELGCTPVEVRRAVARIKERRSRRSAA